MSSDLIGDLMDAAAQLADLVNDHLGRGTKLDPAIAAVVIGLAELSRAFVELQEATGAWERIVADLRSGTAQVRYGLDVLRAQPGFEGLIAFAERQRAFATTMIDAVIGRQGAE